MKKKFVILVMTTASALLSCQSEQIPPQQDPAERTSKVFRFTVEDQTKAAFNGEMDFDVWPYFAVYPGVKGGHKYEISGSELIESDYGTEFAVPTDTTPIPDNVAVYPYACSMTPDQNGKLVCVYDSSLQYDSQTGLYSVQISSGTAKDYNTMVAATAGTDDDNLLLKNIQGYLKLSLKGDFEGIVLDNIIITGNDNEILAGENYLVTFSHDHLPEMTAMQPYSYEYCYDADDALLSTSEPTDFYINFPAMTFGDGITVKFKTNYGDIIKKTHQEIVIERSKVQPLAQLTLTPAILLVTDLSTGYSFRLTGRNVVSVKTGVFTKVAYDADPEGCKEQVRTSGKTYSSAQLAAINSDDGEAFVLTGLTNGGNYVLVVYYENESMYGVTCTYDFVAVKQAAEPLEPQPIQGWD